MRSRPLLSYGVALLSVAIAVSLRLAIPSVFAERFPFLTFFVAAIVSAGFGGFGPGLLAVALGLVGSALVPPAIERPRFGVFLVVNVLVVLLLGWLRVARDRAQRAHQSELDARRAAEAARERASLLADGNVVLTASLDYDETLSSLAGLVVPRLADWCAVDVVEADGAIRRAAVTHNDPAKSALVQATTVYEPDPEGRHPRTQVMRTGRSWLVTDVSPELIASIAANPEHLRVMLEMGYVSAMIVPLVARGRTLGTITCATMESGRHYGPDDLALAENVAMRAALALDNARLYREAETARTEAERANRAKDQFLSVVSHELKTPLAATLGWLRILRSGKVEHLARALDTIERSTRVQTQLVDDLLDISRIVAGRVRLEMCPVDLARSVEAVIDMIRPEAAAKRLRLDASLAAPVDRIAGDRERVQQIVWNLLSNAVKFTAANGSVSVRLEQQGSQVKLTVQDTGRGIGAEFLPHVFERFRQAEPVTSRDTGGLGLGLAIARHLVELHGGTISVASGGEGKGSTFTVALPASPLAPTVPASTEVAGESQLDQGRPV